MFFIGGEPEVLEKARPQLEANARSVVHIGEIGQAAAMKIATNLIAAVTVGSFAEALSLLDASGVPLFKLGEALQNHPVHSPLADLKLPTMIAGDFDARFSLKNMFKDVQIALSMAQEFTISICRKSPPSPERPCREFTRDGQTLTFPASRSTTAIRTRRMHSPRTLSPSGKRMPGRIGP